MLNTTFSQVIPAVYKKKTLLLGKRTECEQVGKQSVEAAISAAV